MKFAIVTIKQCNIDNAMKLKKIYKDDLLIITQKEELTEERLRDFQPRFVFFPHWSYIIPRNIYENFECIVFHMTDLPFGRGGSPLQNLIVRGIKSTKVSAIRVEKEIDAGPIYMKEPLTLEGTCDEVLGRVSTIIFEKMIPQIINNNPIPEEQVGDPVFFKRRKPEESELKSDMSLDTVYDYIRMLDGEGYPKAFIDYNGMKLEFSDAIFIDGKLTAKVEFVEEKNE